MEAPLHCEITISTDVDFDLETYVGKGDDLGLKTVSKAFLHGSTIREDHVLGQLPSSVNVGSLNGFQGECVDSSESLSVEFWLEE